MPTIEKQIECQACGGTGLYQGIAEGPKVAVVCRRCGGTGEHIYRFSYNEFTGRKKRDGVERVFKKGYGFRIGLGTISFSGIGEVDMNKEGVSYDEFLGGKLPEHIKTLACPMMADQGACHKIKGFVDECDVLNGGSLLGEMLSRCNYQKHKANCWKRFEEQC